jgi:hypothetical protein
VRHDSDEQGMTPTNENPLVVKVPRRGEMRLWWELDFGKFMLRAKIPWRSGHIRTKIDPTWTGGVFGQNKIEFFSTPEVRYKLRDLAPPLFVIRGMDSANEQARLRRVRMVWAEVTNRGNRTAVFLWDACSSLRADPQSHRAWPGWVIQRTVPMKVRRTFEAIEGVGPPTFEVVPRRIERRPVLAGHLYIVDAIWENKGG